MTPKEIIDNIPGLTRDQLSYFAKMGYIVPVKSKRGKNEYSEFSNKDFLVIKKAYYYIKSFGTKPQTAFEKAEIEYLQTELNI